jgi:signal transduction histidine kinase
MNLMTNAAEAIEDQGMIKVATGNQYLVPEEEGEQGLPEGEYVVLSVEDNGPGISDTDLEHIFEPFYTRKMMMRPATSTATRNMSWWSMTSRSSVISAPGS